MKAWVVVKNGPATSANLQLQSTRPLPTANAGTPTGSNILVKITHAALNPADIHFINVLPTWLPFRRVATPGLDFAGSIVALGPAVPADANLEVGTTVCGALAVAQVFFGAGSLAEYVMVPASLVAVKPERLSNAQAAGLMGVAGQTASLMVQDAALKAGQRVLINGASGGVGSVLVQVVKGLGVKVYAVCSGANEEMVRRLGADEVIDYKVHDPVENFLIEKFKDEPFDIIFDCVGGDPLYTQSPKYLKPGCKFITIVGGPSQGIIPFIKHKLRPVFLGGTPRPFHLLGLSPAGTFARQAAKWVDEGLIKEAPIDSEYTLEEVVQAYERVASKRAKGKVIIKVSE
ncbi:hypothetical protein B0T22DRAFT_387711 [Podospora appendiculata]|uniref:Enoyl reductase (ER) domain-containing protein n=1 Tax=Podospora appendiculata TaxID=314037 RepID=A0AAE0WZR0_9PEZI|nr:hypothetical protein B0T22DRAFT_387711 [Podospora appendiculata]